MPLKFKNTAALRAFNLKGVELGPEPAPMLHFPRSKSLAHQTPTDPLAQLPDSFLGQFRDRGAWGWQLTYWRADSVRTSLSARSGSAVAPRRVGDRGTL